MLCKQLNEWLAVQPAIYDVLTVIQFILPYHTRKPGYVEIILTTDVVKTSSGKTKTKAKTLALKTNTSTGKTKTESKNHCWQEQDQLKPIIHLYIPDVKRKRNATT